MLQLHPDRPPLCTYVFCTGIVVVNAARKTVCMYVHAILRDLHYVVLQLHLLLNLCNHNRL